MTKTEKTIQFWTLNIASFLAQTGIIIINLSLVYFLTAKNESPTFIGFASAIYTFVYLAGCLAFGRFYQQIKPIYMVLSSLLGMALSTVLVITLDSDKYFTLVFLALYGLSMSMLWPQMESWITRGKEGKELNKATSGFNLSWSFAAGCATYIGSFFITKGASIGLFSGVVSLLSAVALLIIVSLSVPALRAVKGEAEAVKEIEGEDHSTVLRFYSWIGVGIVYVVLSILNNVFPIYGTGLGFNAKVVGFLLLVRGMTTMVTFIVLGKTNWWQFKISLILLCQGALALCCFLAISTQNAIVFGLIFFFIGILVAFLYDFSIFHSASGAINRNSRMIIHEVVLNVGSVLGSLFGGSLYEFFGFSFLLLTLGIAVLVIVAAQGLVYKVRRNR